MDIANYLIGKEASLLPDEGADRGEVHIVQWQNMDEEAQGIAQYIDTRIKREEFDAGNVLVLCPRRQFGYAIRDALITLGRSAHSFFHEEILDGNPKEQDNCAAQQAFTLLRLLINPYDRVGLRCWLGFGNSQLRCTEYQRFREYCENIRKSPKEILDSICNGQVKPPAIRIQKLLERYEQLLEHLSILETKSDEEKFDYIFPEDQKWAKPFRDLVQGVFETTELKEVYDLLLTNITQPELPTDVDYVRIMSLHKSKGLNADHVIVTGCIQGLIPTVDKNLSFKEQERFREEQRRLFYVAITRPKKTLVLSSVLRLPRSLAHKMGAMVRGGNKKEAGTIASELLGELGPISPSSISGREWRY